MDYDLEKIRKFTIDRESAGGTKVGSGSDGTAYGKYQFVGSTWLPLFTKMFPKEAQSLTKHQQLLLRNDDRYAKPIFDKFTEGNAKVLEANGIAPNESTLYAAHYFGPQRAVQIIRSDPSEKIAKFFSKKELDANPNLKTATIQEEVSRWNNKVRQNSVYDPYIGKQLAQFAEKHDEWTDNSKQIPGLLAALDQDAAPLSYEGAQFQSGAPERHVINPGDPDYGDPNWDRLNIPQQGTPDSGPYMPQAGLGTVSEPISTDLADFYAFQGTLGKPIQTANSFTEQDKALMHTPVGQQAWQKLGGNPRAALAYAKIQAAQAQAGRMQAIRNALGALGSTSQLQ